MVQEEEITYRRFTDRLIRFDRRELRKSLGEAPIARTEIAAPLETPTTSISRVRQELIDRGLIEPAGRGKLRFTIPGFGTYLRDDARLQNGPDPVVRPTDARRPARPHPATP